MTDVKDGGPAFGSAATHSRDDGQGSIRQIGAHPGMTLRDWFAGRAMQAVVTGFLAGDQRGDLEHQHTAEAAYAIADAMLAARSRHD
jgi:hypothetical protein